MEQITPGDSVSREALAHFFGVAVRLERDIYALEQTAATLRKEAKTRAEASSPPADTKSSASPAPYHTGSGKGNRIAVLLSLLALSLGIWLLLQNRNNGGNWGLFLFGLFLTLGSGMAAFLAFGEMPRWSRARRTARPDAKAPKSAREAVLLEEAARLEGELKRMYACKDRLYDGLHVPLKYQNLKAICFILESLGTGQCATLEGEDGAYAILEKELCADLPRRNSGSGAQKRSDAAYDGMTLYRNLLEAQSVTDRMTAAAEKIAKALEHADPSSRAFSERLEEMERDSQIGKIRAEMAQRQLEYMNFMNYHAENYGDRYIDPPPR